MAKQQSDQKQRAIAQAWRSRRAGVTQAEFCAEHGIGSTRTLRSILYQYAAPEVPLERVRAILWRAIQELITLVDSISEVSNELPIESNFGSAIHEQRNDTAQVIRPGGGVPSQTPPIETGTRNHLPVGNTQSDVLTVESELPRGNSDRQLADPQGNSVRKGQEGLRGKDQPRRTSFWDWDDKDENVS
jgi:hypothetical protein